MLDTFLYVVRASKEHNFIWDRAEKFASTLLSKASTRAILLASPHIPWHPLRYRGDLVERWAVATSAVPYTEEFGQSVVDTLLQIASEIELLPLIPVDAWSWLTRQPSLPPVCLGRRNGTYPHVVKAVRKLRGLGNVWVLKSYLLLVWAEWDPLLSSGLDEMCTSIREDFGGIGMDNHRQALIQRIDHILDQLALGLEHLEQHNPNLTQENFLEMRNQYRRLSRVLLETGSRAIPRTSYPIVILLSTLTCAGCRIS